MGRIPILFVLCLSCAALANSGCTIAGTAIGAATPRYERTDWPRDRVELGARVRVHVRTIGSEAVRTTEVDGRYGGVHEGILSVTDDDGREHEIAARDVLDVEVRNGTEWKKGLLLGAAGDALIVVAAVVVANDGNVSITTTR